MSEPFLPHQDPALRPLERATLLLEAPLFRWIREPWLFLFYHSGTLAFWTLVLLGITGLYVTLFYHFGFTDSYTAIQAMDSNVVSRIMRSAHRYLGDLFLLFALLHAWRMFVQNRFRGPRWLGWVAGVGLLVLTWIIGVTGFWMLADVQAQWLHAWLMQMLMAMQSYGVILAVLLPGPNNPGWIYMVALFFVHVGLTILLGLVYWWHIKHLNRPRWLPIQPLMVLVLVGMVLLSLAWPVAQQPSWDFTRWPDHAFLNTLYLLLLPDALEGGWWAPISVVVLLVLMALPWWWRFRSVAEPVVLKEAACIGCTLCAQDCPYQALEMVPREGPGPKWVARLHEDRCVGCGVCVGSCPTDALHLPHPAGTPEALRERIQRAAQRENGGPGPRVVFTCYRHLAYNAETVAQLTQEEKAADPAVRVIGVPCVGVLHPDVLALAWEAGASHVQVVGCPPEDCPERYGNTWLEGRLIRIRKPWLRGRWQNQPLTLHWVPPTEFREVVQNPASPSVPAHPQRLPEEWPRWLRHPAWWKTALLLAVGLAFVAFINLRPYAGPTWAQKATVDFIVEHFLGNPLHPAQAVEPASDGPWGLHVWVDERSVGFWPVKPQEGKVTLFARVQVEPGTHHLTARLDLPGEAWQLLDVSDDWEARCIYAFPFHTLREHGDPVRGEALFFEQLPGENTGCRLCHSLEPGVRLVGPSLANIGNEAATRVPGMSAEEYIRESIVNPDAYVVPGYPAGQMPPNYREFLSEEDIQDLVAFLLTLKTGEASPTPTATPTP